MMTIYNRDRLDHERIKIDLSGPQGNAYVLMGLAQRIYGQLNPTVIAIKMQGATIDEIINQMTSGDYDNLVAVFDRYFGDWVDLYKDGHPDDGEDW